MNEDSAPAGGRVLCVRTTRMTMGDTDAAGLLYFGAVYPWLEQMFTTWLYDVGHPLSALLASGAAVPCVHSEATYRYALTLDMPLVLTLRSHEIGRTSFGFTLDVHREGAPDPGVRVRSRHVFGRMAGGSASDRTLRPEPLPSWLREALS